jgi:hypothetical protein
MAVEVGGTAAGTIASKQQRPRCRQERARKKIKRAHWMRGDKLLHIDGFIFVHADVLEPAGDGRRRKHLSSERGAK